MPPRANGPLVTRSYVVRREQAEALDALADLDREETGEPRTVSRFVREALEDYLTRERRRLARANERRGEAVSA